MLGLTARPEPLIAVLIGMTLASLIASLCWAAWEHRGRRSRKSNGTAAFCVWCLYRRGSLCINPSSPVCPGECGPVCMGMCRAMRDGDWTVHLEKLRLVRNFMATPAEMIAVEAVGTLCLLIGVFGVVETEGNLLDGVWAGYGPFFIGVCLLLLFVHGLFQPWWLSR